MEIFFILFWLLLCGVGGGTVSKLSEIFKSYNESLIHSLDRYDKAYLENAQNAKQFYDDFLKDLFIDYGKIFSNHHQVDSVITRIEEYFQRRDIPFVAIDGTCSKDPFDDFMVFFAAAYGVKGTVYLESHPTHLRYERWSMDQDVSLVSYVPIPYAEAGDITDASFREEFIVDDRNKINLSSIHTRLMQLSEIYLAYEMARSSTVSCPRLILMDLSLSSVLMSTDVGLDAISLFGHPIGSRQLSEFDGLVSFAHPINGKLDVPSSKAFRRWTFLVRYFSDHSTASSVSLDELVKLSGVSRGLWEKSLHESYARMLFSLDGDRVSPKIDVCASWFDSVRLFEDVCDRLFKRKEPDALIYPVDENGETRLRWMSPEDLAFLTSIGVKALCEKCWENNIMLLSIAKDSSSKFFSRNYIGVMREIGEFPLVSSGLLPWTDRVLLESISVQLDGLGCPWAVTEFDSAFMSLHVEKANNHRFICGNRGYIVNSERLFARSLAQFFYQNKKSTPLMGHVIFLDRLIDPVIDKASLSSSVVVSSSDLGEIHPVFFGKNDSMNFGQAMAMWFLKVLTKNLFPEIIGYPDPLHKADWGAKTVKNRVEGLIKSTDVVFRSRPRSRTLRQMRAKRGR
jgi:hypothetical protein